KRTSEHEPAAVGLLTQPLRSPTALLPVLEHQPVDEQRSCRAKQVCARKLKQSEEPQSQSRLGLSRQPQLAGMPEVLRSRAEGPSARELEHADGAQGEGQQNGRLAQHRCPPRCGTLS